MQYMWSDTLQALERAHLLRLIVWGGANILAGTAIIAWLKSGARESPLLRHFAFQCIGWGIVEAIIGAAFIPQLTLRDLAGATRLDRFLWLNIGLDFGYVLAGLTLAATAWRLNRSPGAVGAGTAIMTHGLALALLDLVLASQISR
jgi:hypothetical protein